MGSTPTSAPIQSAVIGGLEAVVPHGEAPLMSMLAQRVDRKVVSHEFQFRLRDIVEERPDGSKAITEAYEHNFILDMNHVRLAVLEGRRLLTMRGDELLSDVGLCLELEQAHTLFDLP